LVAAGFVVLGGVGGIAGDPTAIFVGTTNLSGVGGIAGDPTAIFVGTTSLDGAGGINGDPSLELGGRSTIAGVGNIFGDPTAIFGGRVVLNGIGGVIADPSGIFVGVSTLAGIGSLFAEGANVLISVGGVEINGTTFEEFLRRFDQDLGRFKEFKFQTGEDAFLDETGLQPHRIGKVIFDGRGNRYRIETGEIIPEFELFTFSEMKNRLVITEEECEEALDKIERLKGNFTKLVECE